MDFDIGGALSSPGRLVGGTRRIIRLRATAALDNITAATVSGILDPGQLAVGELSDPSPDEMIITARGRRSIPLTFSPDVYHTPLRGHPSLAAAASSSSRYSKVVGVGAGAGQTQQCRGWQTPPNSCTRLLLPTRTSPRKRLTLTDSPPPRPPSSDKGSSPVSSSTLDTPSPDKAVRRSPISKRFKMGAACCAHQSPRPDSGCPVPEPAVMLRGLSQDQLVSLLGEMMAKRPDLKEMVREHMPEPDLTGMEELLNTLKRNIFKSLPNTRLESKTDSMAYNRVATHLLTFKKAIVDQGKRLCDAHAWAAVLDHSLMAWGYVKSTPVWDNHAHNNVRRQCFKALAANALQAVKKASSLTPETGLHLKNRFLPLEKDSEDIGLCLKQLDLIISSSSSASAAAPPAAAAAAAEAMGPLN